MTSDDETSATRMQSPRDRGEMPSEADPWSTQTVSIISANLDTSQAGRNREGAQQVRGLPPRFNEDDLVMSDANDERESEKKLVAVQTNEMSNTDVTNKCLLQLVELLTKVLGAVEKEKNKSAEDDVFPQLYKEFKGVNDELPFLLGAVKKEKNKSEGDIYHRLYKEFKDVNDKLQLLENAISRLGGVRNVLCGIRQLRAALVIALYWDKHLLVDGSYDHWFNFRDDVTEGRLESAEKVLASVCDWPELKEDGTVFASGLSDVKLLVERVSESAGAMWYAFDQLGTVNGCQFVSLCTAFWAVRKEIWVNISGIERFVVSEGEQLAIKHLIQELPKLMRALSDEISKAIERDIPNLRTVEQSHTTKFNSMRTTAAFFSGITITAIQTQLSLTTANNLADAVNTVWIASLVFSVASVIASLIGSSYFHSHIPMRTKENKFKKGVIFLLRNGPAMLMTAAAVTFMIGLALFVHASSQVEGTSKIVTPLIISVSAVLVFLTSYFALFYVGDATTRLWRNIVLRIWELVFEHQKTAYQSDL